MFFFHEKKNLPEGGIIQLWAMYIKILRIYIKVYWKKILA